MSEINRRTGSRVDGFSLLEVVVGIVTLVVGLVALAGVLLLVSRQREEIVAGGRVLRDAQNLLEEMHHSDPVSLKADYDGKTYDVSEVEGANPSGRCLCVSVDDTQAKLLWVTVRGVWAAGGSDSVLELETYVYNPQG